MVDNRLIAALILAVLVFSSGFEMPDLGFAGLNIGGLSQIQYQYDTINDGKVGQAWKINILQTAGGSNQLAGSFKPNAGSDIGEYSVSFDADITKANCRYDILTSDSRIGVKSISNEPIDSDTITFLGLGKTGIEKCQEKQGFINYVYQDVSVFGQPLSSDVICFYSDPAFDYKGVAVDIATNANKEFESIISISGQEGSISGTIKSATDLLSELKDSNGNVRGTAKYLSFSEDLVDDPCPIIAIKNKAFYNEITKKWRLVPKSEVGSYVQVQNDFSKCLKTLSLFDNDPHFAPPVDSQECASNVNSAVNIVRTSSVQINELDAPDGSALSAEGNAEQGFFVLNGVESGYIAELELIIDMDWLPNIAVIQEKADYEILNANFRSDFEVGRPGFIDVTLKNTGNINSTANVFGSCSEGFTVITKRQQFDVGETGVISAIVQGGCEEGRTSGTCDITVGASEELQTSIVKNIPVGCNIPDECVEGGTRCGPGMTKTEKCENGRWVTDQPCEGVCEIDTDGLPICVTFEEGQKTEETKEEEIPFTTIVVAGVLLILLLAGASGGKGGGGTVIINR